MEYKVQGKGVTTFLKDVSSESRRRSEENFFDLEQALLQLRWIQNQGNNLVFPSPLHQKFCGDEL